MKNYIITATLALLFFSGPALAQQNQATPYLGIDALFWEFEVDDAPSFSATGLKARAGAFFNQNFAIEAHIAMGGSDAVSAVTQFDSFSVDIELDRLISIFGRINLPIATNFNLYGLLGYSDAKVTITVSDQVDSISVSDTDSGLSFGIGAEMRITDSTFINGDYIRYLDESGYQFSGFSAGVRFEF